MGFIEKRDVHRPMSGEAPFAVDELFFSRTDERGVIQSANYIFMRVSGYKWDELLGAPHKIIRHPDMPKSVYWLLWDALNKGEPVGAYLKNKANDGLHYWVYAVVMPYRDGFLSVRLKPTSNLLGIIEKEYATLRQTEIEDGITPEASAADLLQRIQSLGYADYQAFSSDALMQELSSRDKAMGKLVPQTTDQFSDMISVADCLKNETAALSRGFDDISTVPTNMRIIAARLEPSGGAISSLAQNYWEMSEEMSRWFQNYVSGSDSSFLAIRDMLISSQFLCGAARVLNELSEKFSIERRSLGGVSVDGEKSHMKGMATIFVEKAISGMQEVASEAEKILRSIAMMRRFTLGLSSTRVMCNIESARLMSGGDSLIYVINQLEQFQMSLVGQLNQIEAQSHLILEYAQSLQANQGGLITRP